MQDMEKRPKEDLDFYQSEAKSIALAAWEATPLCASSSTLLMQTQLLSSYLSPDFVQYLNFAKHSEGSALCVDWNYESLEQLKSPDLEVYLSKLVEKEEFGLVPLHFSTIYGFKSGKLGWLEDIFSYKKIPIPPFLSSYVLGDIYLARFEYAKALEQYEISEKKCSSPGLWEKIGHCYKMLGDREKAKDFWLKTLSSRVWDLSLAFKLHDLIYNLDLPLDIPPGQGIVLLSGWTHADHLDNTFKKLMESKLGPTKILVADNGESYGAEKVLEKWEERFNGKLEKIVFPVNIGRPAARNWLLADKRVKGCDWVVFLDGNVEVSPDWLGYFGRSMQIFPHGDIFGCKVVDKDLPHQVQIVDINLEEDLATDLEPNPYSLLFNSESLFDAGEHDYLCPSMSVAEVCQLVTRKSLNRVGSYDISFLPSRLSNLDRNLRSVEKNSIPIYNGSLKVAYQNAKYPPQRGAAYNLAVSTGFKEVYPVERIVDLRKKINASRKSHAERILARSISEL